ncbi:MAG: tetratricopeptide repeat protein [Methylobacter sp.]
MPVNTLNFSAQTPLAATVKYNPHLWEAEELRAIFVARTRELAELLAHLKATPVETTPQHILITGARGMGKSTLLHRVALGVADDPELAAQWIALTFPEEQYTVSTLAELWSNVLDALADTLERQGASVAELAQLDDRIRRIGDLPPAEREAAALQCLERWISEHQRRLLLLIDSTDLLFSGLSGDQVGGRRKNAADDTPLWRLRKTLSHQPGIFWLGASYQALESNNQYQDAFMDFFQLMELRPLKLEDMRAALLALARTFGAGRGLTGEAAVAEMTRSLDSRPERLKALRTMTGGNPRTTVMLYELFAAGGQDDIHSDLRRLLDNMTPLYKARMESLSEQACKLFAHVMENWAPISANQLGKISGIATGTVSGQLTRLEAEGLIEKTELPGTKRVGFQAGERLFNIWYLMRYASRRLRQRLTWLVEFMRLWYSGDELCQLARYRAGQHRSGRLCGVGQLEYSRAMGLALAEDDDARYQLEFAVYNAARIIDQTRQALSELFELDGEDIEYTTAEDYLNRFQALDALLAACPHMDDETCAEWIAAVKSSVSLNLAEKEQVAQTAATLSESEYRKFLLIFDDERKQWEKQYSAEVVQNVYQAVLRGEFFPDCPNSKLAHGQIMACFGENAFSFEFALRLFLKNHQDEWVEKAFYHAIKLNPDAVYLRNNLGNLLAGNLGRPEEAEAAYRRAIELDPKYAVPWNNLGNVLSDYLDHPEEAEMAYRRAIELDPKHAVSWNNLGDLLADNLGRAEEAEAAYRQAIKLDPKHAALWNNLGNFLVDDLGRPEEAEAAYSRAIALDPKFVAPWNNLGDLLADSLARPKEAEAAYRRAMELDVDDPYPAANLARLLARIGQTVEAVSMYRRTAEQAQVLVSSIEGNIDYVELLLQAHLYLGNSDSARQALERLAQAAARGNKHAFFKIKEQTLECFAIGLGVALMELQSSSVWSEFLQPFTLALAAATQNDSKALSGAPAEVRSLAEEVLEELLKSPKK